MFLIYRPFLEDQVSTLAPPLSCFASNCAFSFLECYMFYCLKNHSDFWVSMQFLLLFNFLNHKVFRLLKHSAIAQPPVHSMPGRSQGCYWGWRGGLEKYGPEVSPTPLIPRSRWPTQATGIKNCMELSCSHRPYYGILRVREWSNLPGVTLLQSPGFPKLCILVSRPHLQLFPKHRGQILQPNCKLFLP